MAMNRSLPAACAACAACACCATRLDHEAAAGALRRGREPATADTGLRVSPSPSSSVGASSRSLQAMAKQSPLTSWPGARSPPRRGSGPGSWVRDWTGEEGHACQCDLVPPWRHGVAEAPACPRIAVRPSCHRATDIARARCHQSEPTAWRGAERRPTKDRAEPKKAMTSA